VLNYAIKKSIPNLPFTIAPYSWGNITRLDYRPSKSTSIFLTFITTDEIMKIIDQNLRGASTPESSAENEISESTAFNTVLFGYDQNISESLQNTLRLAYTSTKWAGNLFALSQEQQNIDGSSIRDQFSYTGFNRLKIITGLDASPNLSKFNFAALGSNGVLASSRQIWISDIAAYVKAEYTPIDKLTLIPGVRYDYYSDIQQAEPSLRLSTRYNYISGHTVTGSIGTYSQDPQPAGLSVDSIWGNPKLPPTLGTQSTLGYECKIIDLFNVGLQGYYNTQTNIPEQTDSISPITGTPLNFLGVGKGKIYGLELTVHRSQGKHFFGWIAYSLSRNLRNSPTMDQNSWLLSPYDQTHNLIILGSWKLPWTFMVGFKFRYTTGNPIIPQTATADIAHYDAETGSYDRLSGPLPMNRTGSSQELDLKFEKKFVYEKWTLSAYIDMQNINYSWFNGPTYYYSFDGFENGNLGNLFIPSFGLRAEF
jgi:outer membrane receptor protein involved in Fe transport